MKITKFWLRATGIFGILGGFILLSGDMLSYYDSNSTDVLQNMSKSSDLRIMLSGLAALFAAWFYMLGLIHVYYAFKPATTISRNIVLISFASILIAFGVIHAFDVVVAITAKLSLQNGLDIHTGVSLARKSDHFLRLFVYPGFAVLSFVFIVQVWKRKTYYPRWIILFYPLISFLLQGIVGGILTGTPWLIIIGGYYNIILIIFFTASTIALWNKNHDETPLINFNTRKK